MIAYLPFLILLALIGAAKAGSTYARNVLIALDCVGTALIGGWPGETMSSYAYRMDQQGKLGGRICRPAIDWLFAWQHAPGGHCYTAWCDMKARLNIAPEYRT